MADTGVWNALIAAVPATIVGAAAWRSAAKGRRSLRTSNGKQVGQYVEDTAGAVQEAKLAAEAAKLAAEAARLAAVGFHLAQVEALNVHNVQDEDRFRRLESLIQQPPDPST